MITITKTTAISSLGENLDEIFNSASAGIFKGMKITADLPVIKNPEFNSRCNRILLHCINQMKDELDALIEKYGSKKIGVVIATTNSGIDTFEDTGNKGFLKMSNPAEFVRDYLGLNGFYCGVSTACSSGIKVFSTALKLLENGICDAVLAGGADELSKFPLAGFSSLEVLSKERSIPMSKNRKGMNIGEGGALFIVEKSENYSGTDGINILGIGETSDAYHAATPDPVGVQAAKAMEIAIKNAGIRSEDIDYINLHGTGTGANDIMEANAIYSVFGDSVPVSSTKPLTGHCLGASASIEIALCCRMLGQEFLLPHIYDGEYDEKLPKLRLAKLGEKSEKINCVMCNAFGFGGTNAVIILSTGKKYNLEKILPHKYPMILIDDVVEYNFNEGYIIAKVVIKKDNIFFDNEINGISYITGIEFMAQTVGCYAHLKSGENEPKIGFLLGSRSYKSSIDKFELGRTYFIKAKEIFSDNELVSFECFIYNENIECASAMVNVYQPKDAFEFME